MPDLDDDDLCEECNKYPEECECEGSLAYVRQRADNEGFDYCFRRYSNFEEVEDEEFHKRRKAYIEAYKALADYIGYKD